MEILLGGISSLFFGIGDFLGGEGSKRAPAASVVLWAGVISTPFIVIVAVVVGGTAGLSDFAIGALAGVSGSIGLVLLFAGLARGQAAAVAPIAAAFGAVVPVVAAVIGGERPSTLAWAGVLVAIPAIMLSAWVVEPGDLPGGGFLYGVAAGLGFGGFTAIIASTSARVRSGRSAPRDSPLDIPTIISSPQITTCEHMTPCVPQSLTRLTMVTPKKHPRISNQPGSFPSPLSQAISTSAEGSVNGK